MCYSYGQHLSTRDVITDEMTHKFTYNVKSYYGRLVRVNAMSAGRAVIIRRDYRQHPQQLTAVTTAGIVALH